MQPLRFVRRCLPLLTVAAALMLFSGPVLAQDATVIGTLNYVSGLPGAEIYRYDFTLSIVAVEPACQTLLLFFDSNPANQGFDGSEDCDFHSATGPTPDWEVTPIEPPDPDAWYVEFDNFSSRGPAPGEEAATFSVEILWKNPDTVPPTELFFEDMNGWAHEGITETRIETTAPRETASSPATRTRAAANRGPIPAPRPEGSRPSAGAGGPGTTVSASPRPALPSTCTGTTFSWPAC